MLKSSFDLKNTYLKSQLAFRHIGYPLSIISSAFSCLLGFHPGFSGCLGADDATFQKPALVITRPSNHVQNYSQGPQENFESYQIRLLRSQNQSQAEKIKSLQEELADTNQKLHEVRRHLFKESNPADQARIAELTYQLGQREEYLNRLNRSHAELQGELGAIQKRINDVDSVTETLTSIIEKQGIAKEQALFMHKKELEEVLAVGERQRQSLIDQIQQYEVLTVQLGERLREKEETVQQLDELANRLNESLALKEAELKIVETEASAISDQILAMNNLHGTVAQEHHREIQQLSMTLEEEKAKARDLESLKSQMQELSHEWNQTQEALNREINELTLALANENAVVKELLQNKTDLELKNEEATLAISHHLNSQSELNAQIADFENSLEQEQARKQELESELITLLGYNHEADREKQELSSHLAVSQELVKAKDVETEAIKEHYTEIAFNLLGHLDASASAYDELKMNHEYYQNLTSVQQQEIENRLLQIVALKEELDQLNEHHHHSLAERRSLMESQEDLMQAKEELLEQITVLKEEQYQLSQQNLYNESLYLALLEIKEVLERKTEQLVAQIQAEETRSKQLEVAIADLEQSQRVQLEQNHQIVHNLQQAEEALQLTTALYHNLSEDHKELSQGHEELTQNHQTLLQKHEELLSQNTHLQQDLQYSRSHHLRDRSAMQNAEEILRESLQKIATLELALIDNQQALETHLVHLETERENNKALQNQLERVAAIYAEANDMAQLWETRTGIAFEEIDKLKQHNNDLQSALTASQEKVQELSLLHGDGENAER